ncbi:g5332, partial [Coccomyxa viridis]
MLNGRGKLPYFPRGIWIVIVGSLLSYGVCAQNSADGSSSNAVCTKAGWKSVPFFGAAVSSSEFQPQDLSVSSPYYRGPVERRAIPTGILVALSLVLLISFVLWRVLRCLCICCCRCCCVKPAPYPEEILGTTRQAIIKAIIVLLSLGVCACCAYGMSQIDPQLVSKGLSVINNLKDYMQTVLDTADSIVNGVDGVDALLDQVETVLNVDVNVTDISNGITCIAPFVQDLQPSTCLSYLLDVQHQIGDIIEPSLSFLSDNFTALVATEAPALTTGAATIALAPSFLSSYTTQTDDFTTAAGNLPASGSNPGATDPSVTTLGSALTAFGLPLDGGATSNTGQLASYISAFSGIYSAKAADLSTLAGIQDSLNAITAAGTDLSTTLPLLSAYLVQASTNYTDARPCLISLLARLQHINATVIVLPSSLESAAAELQSVEGTLDAVLLNGITNAAGLASQINAATSSISTTPFPPATLTALSGSQTQLNSITDPDASGGVNQYFGQLQTLTSSASSNMDNCNTAYGTYQGSGATGDYDTLVSTCQTASSSMIPVQTLLGNAGGASSVASGISALSTALASLPSQATVTSSLNSVNSSLSAVPDLTSYIASLTPAVTAYAALGPTVITDMQTQITSINSTITSSIADARSEVANNLGPVQSEINTLHNQTIDRVTGYQNQYQPTVAHYDKIRQIVEYVYFALAMAVCLILAIAALTNCPFLAGFFTLVLLVLTLIYSIVAAVLFLIASIGNDACTNMESYIISEIPSLAGNDASMQSKVTALAGYYFNDQGGPVNAIVQTVAGVNLTGVFAQVNSTRDQAIASLTGSYTLQPKMKAIVDGFVDLSNVAVANITAAEGLASYDNIHPFYIQVKTYVCCSGVNMLGNLWAAMFSTCALSIVLLLFMFIYIRDLDRLPPKGCCGCSRRSAAEFNDSRKPSARDLDMAERLGSGTTPTGPAGLVEDSTRGAPSVQGSAGSRGSLLAPRSAKQAGHKHKDAAYPVHASTPSAPPAQVVQRQEYMR